MSRWIADGLVDEVEWMAEMADGFVEVDVWVGDRGVVGGLAHCLASVYA